MSHVTATPTLAPGTFLPTVKAGCLGQYVAIPFPVCVCVHTRAQAQLHEKGGALDEAVLRAGMQRGTVGEGVTIWRPFCYLHRDPGIYCLQEAAESDLSLAIWSSEY